MSSVFHHELKNMFWFLCSFFATLVSLAIGVPPELDGKIVGGLNTRIEEYPYQISYELFNNPICGGALIKPNYALTAAHCTKGTRTYIAFLTVRAGASSRGQGGQVAKIMNICQHPKFSEENSFDYDVSVLRLERAFDLTASVQAIPLQPAGDTVRDDTVATVTGWGALRYEGPTSPVLQALDVPKINFARCASFFPDENISPRMQCFGYVEGERDACQGDSGGPLVVDGKVIGTVSWGYGCAQPKFPGVYSDVSNVEIAQHIQSCMAA